MSKTKHQSESLKVFGLNLSKKQMGLKDLLTPHAIYLIFGCFLLMVTNLIFMLLPSLLNGGVSLIEKNQAFDLSLFVFSVNFHNIKFLICTILALASCGAVIRTFSRMVIFDVGRVVERDLRARIFFHVSALDDEFYRKRSVGDIMNHMTTDLNNIRLITGFAALNIMNIVFVFILTVPMLLRIDYFLAFCALLPFPLVILATGRLTKKMFNATQKYQEKLTALIEHIQENLLGAHVVRLFHQQERECQRFLATNQNTFSAGVHLAKVRVLMFPVMRLVIGLSLGLVIFVGGHAIADGRISVGDFVEVNARILQLTWPAMSIGFVLSIYSWGMASIARVNDLLAQMPRIKDGDASLEDLLKIDVHNLQINMQKSTKELGLSFSLSRGQTLGIVGESGSGKTSLLKALYRRVEIPDGRIFFNEHDINNLELTSIYNQISVVSQEPFLFHKSIKDNICFAKPDASLQELNKVLKIVCLDSDIKGFKHGLDTIIGERGIMLSGGQRQRVALARAILQKRPLLILDDALSAVDAHTESQIIRQMPAYLGDSMLIIATHRLAVLKEATQILVLKNGLIHEQGTHEELMSQGPLYQELWGFNSVEEPS